MYCRILFALALLCSVFATAARAQYPDHPIRMIVPQAAGSSTDTLTRALAAALSDELHQGVVVDDSAGRRAHARARSRGEVAAGRLHAVHGPDRRACHHQPLGHAIAV